MAKEKSFAATDKNSKKSRPDSPMQEGYRAFAVEDIRKRLDAEVESLSHEVRPVSEINFSTFFNTIDDFLFVIDSSGTIIMVNDTVVERLGYARDELVGKNVLAVHPAERHKEAEEIVRDMAAGKATHCPIPVITKDGRQIPVETRVTPGKWNGRDVLFGVSKDISEIKLSEEKYSKVFHAGGTLMALSTCEDGRFIDVNEAFLQTLGYTREEVVGKTSSELHIFDDHDRDSVLKDISTPGKIQNVEVRIRTKDGALRYGLLSAELLRIQDNSYHLTAMNDITEWKRAEEELRISHAQYRSLFENSLDAIFLTAPHGQVFAANPAACTLFGMTEPEIVEKGRQGLANPDDARLAELVAERARTGHARGETTFIRKNGTKFPAEVSSVILDGGVRAFVIVSDITERIQMEEMLRSSEQHFRSLFETSKDSILLVNQKTGQILMANPAACTLYGYSPEEFLTMRSTDVSGEPERTWESVRDSTGHVPFRLHKKKDGTIFPVEISGGYFKEGSLDLHTAFIRDITERRLAEEALFESEAKYRTLVDNLNAGIFIYQKGAFRFVNKRFCEIFGYSHEEIIDKLGPMDLTHQEDGDMVQKSTKRFFAGELNDVRLTQRAVRKDGKTITISVQGNPITYRERPASSGVIYDITEQERMQEELRKYKEELEQQVKERTAELTKNQEELKIRSATLEEVNIALKVLARQIGEDKKDMEARLVSNVRRLVLPYVEKLKKKRLDPDERSYLSIIEANLSEIISPFIQSVGQLGLSPRETQIAGLIKDGRATKEIAEIIGIAPSAVDTYRNKIRHKLNLTNKKINLQSYLQSIK